MHALITAEKTGIMGAVTPFKRRVLLELSVTTSNSQTNKVLGSRAAVIYNHKVKKYKYYYDDTIVPGLMRAGLILQSNGSWHPASWLALKKLANAAMATISTYLAELGDVMQGW